MFKKGDFIYYTKRLPLGGYDTFPGIILKPGTCGKTKIVYDSLKGDKIAWVGTASIKLQNQAG